MSLQQFLVTLTQAEVVIVELGNVFCGSGRPKTKP